MKKNVGKLKLTDGVVVDVDESESSGSDIDTLDVVTEFNYEISASSYDNISGIEAIEISLKSLFEIGTMNGRKNAQLTAFDIYMPTTYTVEYEDIQFIATDNVMSASQITDDKILTTSEVMTIPDTAGITIHVALKDPVSCSMTDVIRIYMKNADGDYISFRCQVRKDDFFNAYLTQFGRAKVLSGVAWVPRIKAYLLTSSSQSLQQLIATKNIVEIRARLNALEQ